MEHKYKEFNVQEFISSQREILQTFYYRWILLTEGLQEKHTQEQQILLKRLRKQQNSRHYCLVPLQVKQNSRTDLSETRTPTIIIKHHREFTENNHNIETAL